jgi:hypothetical protein
VCDYTEIAFVYLQSQTHSGISIHGYFMMLCHLYLLNNINNKMIACGEWKAMLKK